jgi:hypothetical protein
MKKLYFLILVTNFIFAQKTVEFRIINVSSDVDDMDGFGSGNSDPSWRASINDGLDTQNFVFDLNNINCPGTRTANTTFFTKAYNCNLPTNFTFIWRAFEDDGVGSDANTGDKTVNVPSSALTSSAFVNYGTYTATASGIRCGGGSTVTWGITLQYRVIGTFLPALTSPIVTSPISYALNETAMALSATSSGTGLLWYTQVTGGIGSATAPVPSTSTNGTTSYWVSSTSATSCESSRSQIEVNVGTLSKIVFNDFSNIKLYPNPTQNEVIIEILNIENSSLQILDITGKQVKFINLNNPKNTISTDFLENGIYFFKISNKNSSKTIKVVKI